VPTVTCTATDSSAAADKPMSGEGPKGSNATAANSNEMPSSIPLPLIRFESSPAAPRLELAPPGSGLVSPSFSRASPYDK
jgi:hypothetical protein